MGKLIRPSNDLTEFGKETRAKVAGAGIGENRSGRAQFWHESHWAILNLLVGHDFKAAEPGDAEGSRHRDIGCVP